MCSFLCSQAWFSMSAGNNVIFLELSFSLSFFVLVMMITRLFKALLNAYKIEETNKRMLQKVPRELCQQLQAQEMKVRRMPR
jgi:hypothetical protein